MTTHLETNSNPGGPHSETVNNRQMTENERISKELMKLLSRNDEMGIREISESMGYRSPPCSLRNIVRILISAGVIEYTEPDSPRSPTQKLRLSDRYARRRSHLRQPVPAEPHILDPAVGVPVGERHPHAPVHGHRGQDAGAVGHRIPLAHEDG